MQNKRKQGESEEERARKRIVLPKKDYDFVSFRGAIDAYFVKFANERLSVIKQDPLIVSKALSVKAKVIELQGLFSYASSCHADLKMESSNLIMTDMPPHQLFDRRVHYLERMTELKLKMTKIQKLIVSYRIQFSSIVYMPLFQIIRVYTEQMTDKNITTRQVAEALDMIIKSENKLGGVPFSHVVSTLINKMVDILLPESRIPSVQTLKNISANWILDKFLFFHHKFLMKVIKLCVKKVNNDDVESTREDVKNRNGVFRIEGLVDLICSFIDYGDFKFIKID